MDLIIEISDGRIGVQCKRCPGKISVSVVQEAYAEKDMHDCGEFLLYYSRREDGRKDKCSSLGSR
ncbi:hypothetical protein [Paenibacillus polymyxa]|uniref:hypothetical protein n=1 Tax=Paenibacillus polymyxa TaxID=1406 RepID=UPI00338F39EA